METATKITGGTSIALAAILTIVITSGLANQPNVYVCLDKNLAMQCDKISNQVNNISTRCYFNSTYKTCSSGWIKFENKQINISDIGTDYICDNGTLIKECKNQGRIILRIKND